MWASSFADLAKKASELQEQATAAAASSISSSHSVGFGTKTLFNLDGLQEDAPRSAGSPITSIPLDRNDAISKCGDSVPVTSDECAMLSQSDVLSVRARTSSLVTSEVSRVLPTTKPKSVSSTKVFVPIKKSYTSMAASSIKCDEVMKLPSSDEGSDSAFPSAASDNNVAAPPLLEITTQSPTPKSLTSLLPRPGKSTTMCSEGDYDNDGEEPEAPVSVFQPSLLQQTTSEDLHSPQTGKYYHDDVGVTPYENTSIQALSGCREHVSDMLPTMSGHSVPTADFDNEEGIEFDQVALEHAWQRRQLELESQRLSQLHSPSEAKHRVGLDGVTIVKNLKQVTLQKLCAVQNEMVQRTGSPSVLASPNLGPHFGTECSSSIFGTEGIKPDVPDRVLKSFSSQLRKLEEKLHAGKTTCDRYPEGDLLLRRKLYMLEQDNERHVREAPKLQESHEQHVRRLEQNLDDISQKLQERYKEMELLKSQHLREVRAYEQKVANSEEETRQYRQNAENLQKELMKSKSQISSSNDTYATLKARVKVVAGELKDRRVECRTLQRRVAELASIKAELEHRNEILESKSTSLDRDRAVAVSEVETLKQKLESLKLTLIDSEAARQRERASGEESLTAYKKKAQAALAVANARTSSAIQSKEEAELEALAARSTAQTSMERARTAEAKGEMALAEAKAYVSSMEKKVASWSVLESSLTKALEDNRMLQSSAEDMQAVNDKLTCESKTLSNQLETEKSNGKLLEAKLKSLETRSQEVVEQMHALVAEKDLLCEEFISRSLGTTSGLRDGALLSRECESIKIPSMSQTKVGAASCDKNVDEQGQAESTIRMLQQELHYANDAIRELKETLRGAISGKSEQSSFDISPAALDTDGNPESPRGMVVENFLLNGVNTAVPLFYAMEKQAELAQARTEISRLASLLGDAESSRQEALDAMLDMKRSMEEADARLKRQEWLGSGNLPFSDISASNTPLKFDQAGNHLNVNLEYLKNVVLSYLNAKNATERQALLPVISTVLCFTPEEKRHTLESIEDRPRVIDTVTHGMLRFKW